MGGLVAPAAVGEEGVPARPVVLFGLDDVLVYGEPMQAFVRQCLRAASWRWPLLLACLPWLLVRALTSRAGLRATLGRLALLGVHEVRYQQLVDDFAAGLVRRSRSCSRDGLRALRRCMAEGQRVVVVTACEQRLAEAIFRELGLAEVEVLASSWRGGWSGMRQAQANRGGAKVRLLARHGLQDCVAAYSASLLDVPMWRLATQAVLVNGTPGRCRKLEQALGHAVTRVAWH
ncbi:MAG TPA: haloacid dehalogenase-like hydrolase [Rhodanobacter sp.]|nr:haloacid dehalogenase-like hydrolase [Rhodanobacter sp.]